MEDLTPTDLAELGAALTALDAELSRSLDEGEGLTATVTLDQTAVGRLSRVDALQAQQVSLEQRRRQRLRLQQVRLALKAHTDEEYGDCRSCGDPIGLARLRARPEAPLCAACATRLGA